MSDWEEKIKIFEKNEKILVEKYFRFFCQTLRIDSALRVTSICAFSASFKKKLDKKLRPTYN